MKRQPGALTLSEDDRRVLATWAADCAERTLWLFEARATNDTRPHDAIEGLRAFARGDMRIGAVRALSARAHAAARETDDPPAVAAARACGQAAGVAHMAAHARGAAAYAAKAAGLAAPDDPSAAANEVQWQLNHASPIVRDVLQKLPPPTRPVGILGALINDLHAEVSADDGGLVSSPAQLVDRRLEELHERGIVHHRFVLRAREDVELGQPDRD